MIVRQPRNYTLQAAPHGPRPKLCSVHPRTASFVTQRAPLCQQDAAAFYQLRAAAATQRLSDGEDDDGSAEEGPSGRPAASARPSGAARPHGGASSAGPVAVDAADRTEALPGPSPAPVGVAAASQRAPEPPLPPRPPGVKVVVKAKPKVAVGSEPNPFQPPASVGGTTGGEKRALPALGGEQAEKRPKVGGAEGAPSGQGLAGLLGVYGSGSDSDGA